jgi:hypothetical protein
MAGGYVELDGRQFRRANEKDERYFEGLFDRSFRIEFGWERVVAVAVLPCGCRSFGVSRSSRAGYGAAWVQSVASERSRALARLSSQPSAA